jgi:hypothetical protein
MLVLTACRGTWVLAYWYKAAVFVSASPHGFRVFKLKVKERIIQPDSTFVTPPML